MRQLVAPSRPLAGFERATSVRRLFNWIDSMRDSQFMIFASSWNQHRNGWDNCTHHRDSKASPMTLASCFRIASMFSLGTTCRPAWYTNPFRFVKSHFLINSRALRLSFVSFGDLSPIRSWTLDKKAYSTDSTSVHCLFPNETFVCEFGHMAH